MQSRTANLQSGFFLKILSAVITDKSYFKLLLLLLLVENVTFLLLNYFVTPLLRQVLNPFSPQ